MKVLRQNLSTLILASSSPRRSLLLDQLGIKHKIMPSEGEELGLKAPLDTRLAVYLAKKKLDWILAQDWQLEEEWILAADTLGFLDGHVLGKPKDRNDADRMLRAMSGCEHLVVTGMALHHPISREVHEISAQTKVSFRDLSEDDIQWYLDLEEWKDAAGAYKIQEKGAVLVESIQGDYNTIIGLPLTALWTWLKEEGFLL